MGQGGAVRVPFRPAGRLQPPAARHPLAARGYARARSACAAIPIRLRCVAPRSEDIYCPETGLFVSDTIIDYFDANQRKFFKQETQFFPTTEFAWAGVKGTVRVYCFARCHPCARVLLLPAPHSATC